MKYIQEDLKTDLEWFHELGITAREAESYIKFLLNATNHLENY